MLTQPNTQCFDGLQLCDSLIRIVRERYCFENNIPGGVGQKDYLELWEEHFGDVKVDGTPSVLRLKDFEYDQKFNIFLMR